MKIQAVLIDGFKNLSNVRIRLDNITALVALNNFGKIECTYRKSTLGWIL